VLLSDLVTTYPLTYSFYIKSICSGGESDFAPVVNFQSNYVPPGCGTYKITYVGSPANYGIPKPISYQGCTGPKNEVIFHELTDCLQQSAIGVPVNFVGTDCIIEYQGQCTFDNEFATMTISNEVAGVPFLIKNVIYDGFYAWYGAASGNISNGSSKSVTVGTTVNITIRVDVNKALSSARFITITSISGSVTQPVSIFGNSTIIFNNITVDVSGITIIAHN
jgi:hypothetical protein